MHTKDPTEYLTLAAGPDKNYASIYGYRLANPYACPYVSNSHQPVTTVCRNCVSARYRKAGETRFFKVRLNITNLTVIGK